MKIYLNCRVSVSQRTQRRRLRRYDDGLDLRITICKCIRHTNEWMSQCVHFISILNCIIWRVIQMSLSHFTNLRFHFCEQILLRFSFAKWKAKRICRCADIRNINSYYMLVVWRHTLKLKQWHRRNCHFASDLRCICISICAVACNPNISARSANGWYETTPPFTI